MLSQVSRGIRETPQSPRNKNSKTQIQERFYFNSNKSTRTSKKYKKLGSAKPEHLPHSTFTGPSLHHRSIASSPLKILAHGLRIKTKGPSESINGRAGPKMQRALKCDLARPQGLTAGFAVDGETVASEKVKAASPFHVLSIRCL